MTIMRKMNIINVHFWTCLWVERDTVWVKCLAQEHNTVSPSRTPTQSAHPGLQHSKPYHFSQTLNLDNFKNNKVKEDRKKKNYTLLPSCLTIWHHCFFLISERKVAVFLFTCHARSFKVTVISKLWIKTNLNGFNPVYTERFPVNKAGNRNERINKLTYVTQRNVT